MPNRVRLTQQLNCSELSDRIILNPRRYHSGYGFDPMFFYEFLEGWFSESDAGYLWDCLVDGDFRECLVEARSFYHFYRRHIRTNWHCSNNEHLLEAASLEDGLANWRTFQNEMEREFRLFVNRLAERRGIVFSSAAEHVS